MASTETGVSRRNWRSMLRWFGALFALAMFASGCDTAPEPDLSEYVNQKKSQQKSSDSDPDPASTPKKIYRHVDLVANERLVDLTGRDQDYRTIQFTSPMIFFACGCEPCIVIGRKLAPYSKWVTCITQMPAKDLKAFLERISWKGKAWIDPGGIVMSKMEVLDCPRIFDSGEFVLNELSEAKVLKRLKLSVEDEKATKDSSRRQGTGSATR